MALRSSLVLLVVCLATGIASEGEFCYDVTSACGPSHWPDLDSTCGGKEQSPINVDRKGLMRNSSLNQIDFQGYDTAPEATWTISNNGHAIVVTVGGEMQMSGGGLPTTYKPLQFHFHWGSPASKGSEHTLDKKRYYMELHIVHIKSEYEDIASALSDRRGVAVLGVFLDVTDTDNGNLSTITDALPDVIYKGSSKDLPATFPLGNLLPPKQNLTRYYRYDGSLTTPGCNEAVIWTVFESPIKIGLEQYKLFADTILSTADGDSSTEKLINNFRSVQELNSRTVYASRDATVLSCGNIPLLSFVLSVLPFLAMRLT
nr:PREDICTED: carbonic anhydrase 15-like [Lepisosteus oculatus]XP_015221478.1 PREDICTED: carbonic anhydrase 15-like [Lepisosteus oculatus]XP_015221479.1 PREDICTED: carbonic anhydrase 15-like [Lepisosteus oculatus]